LRKKIFTGSQAVPACPSGVRLAGNKGEALAREESSTTEARRRGEKFSVWGKFGLSRAAIRPDFGRLGTAQFWRKCSFCGQPHEKHLRKNNNYYTSYIKIPSDLTENILRLF